ncbi:MAG: LacI family transcriptional regulator [Alphaproteobacteria bacterium]|nr:LacI family transcriptional regulator [Alphaproteobacteria bacterium]MBU1516895.1 LacI family transcriptional regulator [Alphaproteobacteria bacterium]MBU2092590.1 LacI family transcriptional regulator [Alphaproteobacteria bacterium]MBU2151299.1 LacI family transcriptional regulator [Alphaproteobacteria bacterium]MBU2309601.1 LacI family transcriptional regulator [Alphaproteobacteria bacterium]
MATIQDVARSAGVSTATVSRVLSAPELVAENTRQKVMTAVTALGYAPNQAAKMLRTLKTEKILVTVPDISNPFFSQVIRGVEQAAQAAGYSVLLGDTRHEAEREERYGEMLRRKEADGLIFLGHRLPDSLAEMVRAMGPRAPIVNGCEFSPGLGVSSAHIDNERAAAEAMEHLYGLGHSRIGVLTGPLASPISRDRLTGVRTAARASGHGGALCVETGDFSIESGLTQALALLDQAPRPSALFCFSDEMAMGALEALRERGLRCPHDVSILGFDDIRYARHLDPPLTTIGQPMDQIGHEAVRLLLDIFAGRSTDLEQVTLPHTLVVRASTAAPGAS